ncbi:hypothetical protein PPYR_13012 [Photinus pyralis]|uniref:Kinesin-like protein n=1 Tax=Photinus pyralis TaxID=7054 RepID=A0A5N4A7W1_PHOPY|nr:kinesin-like protein KIF11-B [Photinus pyralis]KAB0793392.1 hypothetical protein PPYR_13012 [Photinus pyralis]
MHASKKVDEGKNQPIRAYVRLRPFHENEKPARALEIRSRDICVNLNNKKKYTFDGVFGPDSKQCYVYQTIAKPLLSEILAGYNCTVFAYGQTGTGKTYTMTGSLSYLDPVDCHNANSRTDSVLDDAAGLIPRVIEKLFDELKKVQEPYSVQCSYLEIYNEDLRDLLTDGEGTTTMRIFENHRNKGAVIIQGLSEITVHSKHDLFKLLQKGLQKRYTASTYMNDRSSRSHAVFSIFVHMRKPTDDGEEVTKTGKLNLVDLAGSENIGRSGSMEQRAREAGNINQSLLTLGRVIKALAENNLHVPFRESKLTRILQDSLGGRTKTVIIATISPCALSIDETLSTLDYAFKAQVITNKPEVNQRMSQKALIAQYVSEIHRLKGDIKAAQTGEGIRMDRDNYNNLVTNLQISKDKVTQSALQIQNLEKELKLLQEEKVRCEEEYEALNRSFEETRVEIEKERELRAKIELEKKTQEYLANRYEKNAQNLHNEANSLLEIVKSTTLNEALLREKVEQLYSINNCNSALIQTKSEHVAQLCDAILHDLTYHATNFAENYSRARELISSSSEWQRSTCDEITNLFSEIHSTLQRDCGKLNALVEEACKGIEELKRENAASLKSLANSLVDNLERGRLVFDSSVRELFESESQRHATFFSNISLRMSQLNSLIASSATDVSNDLETLKEDISHELGLLFQGVQMKVQANEDSLAQAAEFRDTILNAITSSFDQIARTVVRGAEHDAWNVAHVENVRCKLATQSDTILTKLEHGSLEASAICSEHTQFANSKSAILKFEAIVEEHNLYCNDKYTQVMRECENSGADRQRYCEKVCSESSAKLADFEGEVHANIDNMKERLTHSSTNLMSGRVVAEENLTGVIQRIDDYSKERDSCRTNIENKAQQISALLNSTDNDIVDAIPTGNTPVRNRREYPTHLKELTPKDKVLSKFLLTQTGFGPS